MFLSGRQIFAQVRNRFPSPMNSWGTNSRNVTYRNVPVAIDSKTTIGASIVFPSPIFVIKRPIQTPNGAINEKIHIAVHKIFFFGSFNHFIKIHSRKSISDVLHFMNRH